MVYTSKRQGPRQVINTSHEHNGCGASVQGYWLWLVWAVTRKCKCVALLNLITRVWCEILEWLWNTKYFLYFCKQLLKKEEDASYKPVEKACKQVIECLVDKVLSLDEQSSEMACIKGVNQRLVSCLCTLFLFCKVKPELLVEHTMTIQPYLNIKCNVSILWILNDCSIFVDIKPHFKFDSNTETLNFTF